MSEFDMIAKYFKPLTMGRAEAAGLRDDAAVLQIPAGMELVVTTDTLSAGVHFFENAAPDIIARKALRSNLSDLAAMGAEGYCYQLAIAFPEAPEDAFLESLSAALLQDNEYYGVFCSGGDTTRSKGALTMTITAMGFVPAGEAVRRSGAQAGDLVVLSDVVGAGYAAFKKGETYVPETCCRIVDVVQRYAHAAVDVSDGLIADASHIAVASGLALTLRLDDIPVVGDRLEAITGGDDYELVMAVPPQEREAVLADLCMRGCSPAVIGEFTEGCGVRLLDAHGDTIEPEKTGWQHF